MIAASLTTANPFPGLRSFEASEAHLFFGREAHVDELLRKLGRSHFVAVVGTSGSGKSSLVRAGLIPALEAGYLASAGSGWRILLLRPGLDPICSLARSIAGLNGAIEEGYDLETREVLVETTLRRSSLGLIAAAREAGILSSGNLLVIVDQFEEVFRFRRNRASDTDLHENTGAFVKLLLEASAARDANIFVVLTMRSDFLGECPQFPGLPEAINEGQYLIPRMSRDQRRVAIEAPIVVGGATITSRLVQRLLNDVGDSPDQLPVLQHSLMRAWDCWREFKQPEQPIDIDDYERIGTMARALSLHADEAFQSLSTEERLAARQVFQAMCDKDIEGRELRRPVAFSEICAITEQPEQQLMRVVNAFRTEGRTFVIPAYPEPIRPTSVIDISHESLIRLWDRLRGWVEEEAQSGATYRRLAEAALRFHGGEGSLWRDPELRLATEWREKSRPNQAWADRYHPAFIQAIDFLESSRRTRGAQARRRRLTLSALVVAVAAFAILAAGSLLLWRKAVAAEERAKKSASIATKLEQIAQAAKYESDRRGLELGVERDRAHAAEIHAVDSAVQQRALATERQRALEENRDLQRTVLSRYLGREASALMDNPYNLQTAALLAIESLKRDISSEGRSALLEILMVLPKVIYPTPIGDADEYRLFSANDRQLGGGTIVASRFTADNRRVLVVRELSQGFAAEFVDFVRGSVNRTIELQEQVSQWAINDAGTRLAVGDSNGLVRLFDTAAGNVVFSKRVDAPTAVTLGSNEDLLAVGTRGGTLYEFEPKTAKTLAEWKLGCVAATLEFRRDGQSLLSLCEDHTARVAMASTVSTVANLPHDADITAAHFAPDGNTLVTGTQSGTISLFSVSSATPIWQAKTTAAILSIAFTPTGKFVAYGNQLGSVRLIDTASGRESQSITLGDGAQVKNLEISPDGKLLLASDSRGVHLFGTAHGVDLSRFGSFGSTARFSSDSNLISIGSNGSLQIAQNRFGVLSGIEDLRTFGPAQLSPGARFIAIPHSGTLQVLDGEAHRELWSADVGSQFLWSSFSPDERYVAVADQQARATVFELATGRRIGQVKELTYSGNAGVQAPPALSGDGTYIATGNGDRHAQVFETRTGKEVFRAGYGGLVSAVALDQEAKLLAVAQDQVRIYELASKRLTKRIDTGNLSVFSFGSRNFSSAVLFNTAIALSPDRRVLAAALSDHSVRLFDIDSGKELLKIRHQGPIYGLRFGLDGKRLIVTENVGRIMIHPLDPDDLIATTCSLLRRNLTAKEWAKYIGAEPYVRSCPALP